MVGKTGTFRAGTADFPRRIKFHPFLRIIQRPGNANNSDKKTENRDFQLSGDEAKIKINEQKVIKRNEERRKVVRVQGSKEKR